MKWSLLLAFALVGCAAKKQATAKAGVEIVIPIECLTQPVRMLDCDLARGSCRKVIIEHRPDCEQLKVTDGKGK